jgi:hypothetical protein
MYVVRPISQKVMGKFHRYLKKNFQAISLEGRSWEEELQKMLMSYRSIPHPMTGKTPASWLVHREMRTELPSIKNVDSNSSNVEGDACLYQKQMKSYHNCKQHAEAHLFVVGDIVYLARSKFDGIKYVIISFIGRDTCKIVSTLNRKIYVRNVKFLTRAPIVGRELIFNDILAYKEVKLKSNNIVETDHSAKDTVIRTRAGCVSKFMRSKDFVYY